ncbi:MAG: hypothetical protein QF351_01640, partial [Phycisphaerales bacterium]|nr:hypothetical protein [Phycisphaerales bacterium]
MNEASSITTEPTEFVLEGHRPCQHCGYDLVGTPIERARGLDLAVIRCPECGHLNPLIGTPPLGPFAQRAATAGTLVRLLLIGLAAIFQYLSSCWRRMQACQGGAPIEEYHPLSVR